MSWETAAAVFGALAGGIALTKDLVEWFRDKSVLSVTGSMDFTQGPDIASASITISNVGRRPVSVLSVSLGIRRGDATINVAFGEAKLPQRLEEGAALTLNKTMTEILPIGFEVACIKVLDSHHKEHEASKEMVAVMNVMIRAINAEWAPKPMRC